MSEFRDKPASKYYDEAPPLDGVEVLELGIEGGVGTGGTGGSGGGGGGVFRWRPVHDVVVGLLLVLLIGSVVLRWKNPVRREHLEPKVGSLRIDLNTADVATLCVLPGIGPRTAERIIEDRERHGPFRRIGDIQRVNGIGPKTIERFWGYATTGLVGSTGEGERERPEEKKSNQFETARQSKKAREKNHHGDTETKETSKKNMREKREDGKSQ